MVPTYKLFVSFDRDVGVWATEATTVPGLWLEEQSHEDVVRRMQQLAPILLKRNITWSEDYQPAEVAIELVTLKDDGLYRKTFALPLFSERGHAVSEA